MGLNHCAFSNTNSAVNYKMRNKTLSITWGFIDRQNTWAIGFSEPRCSSTQAEINNLLVTVLCCIQCIPLNAHLVPQISPEQLNSQSIHWSVLIFRKYFKPIRTLEYLFIYVIYFCHLCLSKITYQEARQTFAWRPKNKPCVNNNKLRMNRWDSLSLSNILSFLERRLCNTDMQRSLYFYLLQVLFYKGKHLPKLVDLFWKFAPAVTRLTYGGVHSKFLPWHKGISYFCRFP